MNPDPLPLSYEDALLSLRELAQQGSRAILGIAGPPGAGKSTIAARLLEDLGSAAVVVPMDGFHLSNRELERQGLRDHKGAPNTFDAAGYLALLDRIRSQRTSVIYAPSFDRGIDEGVAGSIAVHASTPLVITEGNYLLNDDPQWRDVRLRLSVKWWVTTEPIARRKRLILRHVQFGKTQPDAVRFVDSWDESNAVAIGDDWVNATHVISN